MRRCSGRAARLDRGRDASARPGRTAARRGHLAARSSPEAIGNAVVDLYEDADKTAPIGRLVLDASPLG
jgi:hypothetical protein